MPCARPALSTKDKYGLDVELVTFNDYVLPNEALSKGDIDANAFQHKPYLDQQLKDRGYKLVAVGNTFVYPIASLSLGWRQPGHHYAIRAGRNLPDKEFRYLRTVIVTAAVYRGFDQELRLR